ncbi:uncharacterized protein LOC122509755 [Leptopilina heterotoma]|uniref:uncharacterized protein LOC122505977 n=1 Tax=Leptopilina heterotoma TaxID=63436 RepID=UPI001CA86DF6|nr:uncharacterized protein LOC122505977 [Leptopilina heterotoma]XP_043479930.1 uncharacterized protein LOC122509755 [Leptopilina heterotoma]
MQENIGKSGEVKCQICNEFFINEMWLLDHVKKVHSDSLYTCTYSGCNAAYSNENSLRSHCYRKHKTFFSSGRGEFSRNVNDTNSEDDPDEPDDSDTTFSSDQPDDDSGDEPDYEPDDDPEDDPEDDPDVDMEDNQNNDNNAFKRTIADFILYLRGRTRATNDDVLNILNELQTVVEIYVRYYLNHTAQVLEEALHINLNNYINIEESIAGINCSCNLDSVYKQDVYFEREYGVVNPLIKELGSSFIPSGAPANDGNQPMRRKADQLVHIPISSVLLRMFENIDFHRLIQTPEARTDQVLASYVDGTFFQNHPFRNQKPNSYFIRLYYDEADMCDSLGSKGGGTNKLGFFYWMLEDMLPIYRSQVKFIFLTGIASHSNIKKYGMDSILKVFLEDFKKLEDGIRLPSGEIIYFTLSIVFGDNLAVCELCGFKESFVSTHCCRYCMADLQQIRSMIREDETLLRTPQEHDRQTREIEVQLDEERKKELSKAYGINRRCVLNELIGSHATQTTNDVVHDDLLGYCILTTRLLLNNICLENGYLTLETLNSRIQEFDYGYSQKSSKPSIIKKKHLTNKREGFRQNASQMWQLVTMLPLILCDYVPEACPPYQNFLLMLQILCISFGDKISEPMVNYLNGVTAEYLESFQDIYHINLIPKQHYLLHRASRILKFGPVSHFSTIREEAKHQTFKREAQGKRTYKNLPITLAKKHQLSQASILTETLFNKVQTGPKKLIDTDRDPFNIFFDNDTRVYSTSWTKLNGVKYVAGKCLIAVGYNEDNLPQFAALDKICLFDDDTVLLCKKVETLQHDMSVMAYEIKIVEEFATFSFNDLISHDIFHSHQVKEKTFVIVKKALGDLH